MRFPFFWRKNRTVMNVPAFSIPPLDELGEYDIGAWLWSKPDENSNNAIYGPYVWIYHRDGNWFAGAASDGECLIAGVWKEDPENSSRLGELIGITGKYAPPMDTWTLTNEQRTERIWSFLEVQAITMRRALPLDERILVKR
jgi:hypothetical protein